VFDLNALYRQYPAGYVRSRTCFTHGPTQNRCLKNITRSECIKAYSRATPSASPTRRLSRGELVYKDIS